jgi:hypothetical protein
VFGDEFNCCFGARVTEVVQELESLPSQRCWWDVWPRFSGRNVAVELDSAAGNEKFLEPQGRIRYQECPEFVVVCGQRVMSYWHGDGFDA